MAKPVQYMSASFPLLVTAHSEMFVHYWNLEKLAQGNFNPQGVTQSPLKLPTSALQCFPDGKGYAIASIEGRCGIKNVNLDQDKINGNDDFCFKCHRVEENGTAKMFTVNGLTFNK